METQPASPPHRRGGATAGMPRLRAQLSQLIRRRSCLQTSQRVTAVAASAASQLARAKVVSVTPLHNSERGC
jgi:hypothetical protein